MEQLINENVLKEAEKAAFEAFTTRLGQEAWNVMYLQIMLFILQAMLIQGGKVKKPLYEMYWYEGFGPYSEEFQKDFRKTPLYTYLKDLNQERPNHQVSLNDISNLIMAALNLKAGDKIEFTPPKKPKGKKQ